MNRRQKALVVASSGGVAALVVALTASVLLTRTSYREWPEYRLLLRCDSFLGSAVGFGGDTPETAVALRLLVDTPDASTIFRDLIQNAQAAGQLYALCGLYLVDRAAFDREVRDFRLRDDEIFSFRGCEVTSMPVSRIAAEIEKGDLPVALCSAADQVIGSRRRLAEKPIASWLEQLASSEDEARAEAQNVLYELISVTESPKGVIFVGPRDPEMVPALVRALKHTDDEVREVAADVLTSVGARAGSEIRALLTLLQDPDTHLRTIAARALGGNLEAAPTLLPALEQALRGAKLPSDNDLLELGVHEYESRLEYPAELAMAIARFGPSGLTVLVELLQDASLATREVVADILSEFLDPESLPEPLVERLIALLDDADPSVRLAAARVLDSLEDATPEIERESQRIEEVLASAPESDDGTEP